MTQQEFNEMLARAIAGELGGGTYISRWSGEEIDAGISLVKESGLAYLANGNLLINADFRQPVNRLGQKEYTNVGYAIDRWYLRADGFGSGAPAAKIKLEADGVHITRDASNNYTAFNQRIEDPESILGQTVNLSILISENESSGRVFSGVWRSNSEGTNSNKLLQIDIPAGATGCFAGTAALPPSLGNYSGVTVGLFANPNILVDLKIAAIKLEFGDKQTLAHQDEDGNWVLNDPPNYDLQYLLTSLYSPTTGEWVGIQHSNPNLLDNWYFVGGGSQQGGGQFPVNQRGLTEYGGTTQSYGIDRWVRYGDNPIMLTSDGAKIRASATRTCGLVQRLEKSRLVAGEMYTLSALIQMVKKDSMSKNNDNIALSYGNKADAVTGSMYMVGKVHSGDELLLHTYTFVMPESLDGFYSFRIRSVTGDVEYVVKAMQLERGPIQTLAHQDKEGNWVLNDPPPNYAMELLKCQRYQYVIKHSEIDAQTPSWPGCITSDGKWLLACVVLPVPLAKIPAVVYQNVTTTIRTISGYSNIATFNEPGTPASMGVQYFVGNQDLVLVFTFTSEIGTNNTPNITSLRSGQIILDANL